MLQAIWAQDQNGLIGNNDQLPWYLPADLKYFKDKTLHHTLVMGRHTFEGMGAKALPQRETIILTHDRNYQAENVQIVNSPEEILAIALYKDVFIAGGAAVYQYFLPHCQKLYKTVIDAKFEGDTYFPPVDWTKWQLVARKVGQVDKKNPYPHRFETYQIK